jgi:hypothetical protein
MPLANPKALMRQGDAAPWLLIAAERHTSGDTDAFDSFQTPHECAPGTHGQGGGQPMRTEYRLVRTGQVDD